MSNNPQDNPGEWEEKQGRLQSGEEAQDARAKGHDYHALRAAILRGPSKLDRAKDAIRKLLPWVYGQEDEWSHEEDKEKVRTAIAAGRAVLDEEGDV